jgi:hypothetical protein
MRDFFLRKVDRDITDLCIPPIRDGQISILIQNCLDHPAFRKNPAIRIEERQTVAAVSRRRTFNLVMRHC